MQQATTIPVRPWYRSATTLGTASLAMALLIALAGVWAVGRQSVAPAPAPAEAQPQLRPALSPRFADEAAHAPAVEEYLNPALGDEYLPVDAAPATHAPTMRAQPAPFASPRFADEAASVPAVEEYSSPALGEEYLPVGPVSSALQFALPLSARIIADELAGSTNTFTMMEALDADLLTLTAGPR